MNKAIRSFGLVAAIGGATILLAAVLVLPAVVIWRQRRRADRAPASRARDDAWIAMVAVIENLSVLDGVRDTDGSRDGRTQGCTEEVSMNESQPKNQQVRLKTEIPGPRSKALRAREDAHLAPGLQSYAVSAGIVADIARGSAITDVDGNTFLDLIGGIAVNALGHSHPRMVEALSSQLQQVSVGSLTTESRVDLVERLAAHAPAPGLHRLQVYSSGTEAVESAMRLARCYTGKQEFVSFWGGFHGKTLGAMSLMGSSAKHGYGPLLPGVHHVPYADCYRCPFSSTYPTCGMACVEFARKQLAVSRTGGIAAFVVEPMQGTAGNIIPPPEFLPAIASLARDSDALLIADEMITGFGRTGRYWGVEASGVKPDIVTIGKAFGGGFPLSGLLTTDEISRAEPWSKPSGSSSSYGGNPLAAAAGSTAMRIIDEERLVDNSRIVGAMMLERLAPFAERYSFVGCVRGSGLFLGLELVRDKQTKEPLSAAAAGRIFRECVRRGLLTMAYSPHFRLQPALTIDQATASNALSILEEVFDLVEQKRFWKD
jgi:4-aminobutyrate aminotransferase/(S)-3-amino-2-methylpropionate transaminase